MIRSEATAPGVRRVSIDRPAARNALTPADLTRLEAAITGASEPVVLLVGVGSAFSAGADLSVVESLADPAAFAAHGQRVADAIETTDRVVIAGIDGPARGGGVELALACDVRVATERATFAESGVSLGLFGAWGGTRRLRRELPAAVARDLALSGRTIDAEAAHRWGLVSRIDDPARVAREIADAPPDTLARVRGLLRATDDQATAEAAEREAFAALHDRHADQLRDRASTGET